MRASRSVRVEPLESRQLMSFGQPDPDFGVAGRAAVDFTGSPVELLLDAQGRTVTAGESGLARFTVAGELDPTFGRAGKVALRGATVYDAAIDSSGRILVLATGQSGTLVIRYSAAGKTDRTFATNGIALVTSESAFTPKALAIQSGGEIVVAGTTWTNGDGRRARVHRLTGHGAADASFDSDGTVDVQMSLTDLLNPTPGDVVVDVAATSADKILLLGGAQPFGGGGYGEAESVAVRLSSTGAPDTSFGAGGFARATIGGDESLAPATAARLLADGSIAVASGGGSNQPVSIVRFTADGQVQQEVRPGAFSPVAVPRDLAELPDGRLAVVGEEVSGSYYYGSAGAAFAVNNGGEFTPLVRPKDEQGFPELESGVPQVLAIGDDVLLGGYNYRTGQTLLKIDAGAPAERPAHFARGTVSDVVTDPGGATHVAYYDAAAKALMYVRADPSGVWGAPTTVDASPLAGVHLSIDVDSRHRPAIAYHDGAKADLKLARFDGANWALSTLDSKGSTGQYPSIQFSDADALAIAYYSRRGGDLKLALLEKRKWTFENVDTRGDVGRSAVLQYTPRTGRPSIAYTSTSGEVKYAVRTKPRKWTLTTVATTQGGAAHLDLKFGGYDSRGAISFQDVKNADLKLAHFDGTAWQTRTLATAGVQGLHTQIWAPYDDSLFVLSYNKSRDRLELLRTYWSDGSSIRTSIVQNRFGQNLSAALGNDGKLVLAGYDAQARALHVTDLVYR